MFNIKLFKGEFSKNAITLIIGTSIAQAIPIIFYPILARIFTAEEFGLLATLNSITTILVTISTLSYEKSILVTKRILDAANIVVLVTITSLLFLTIISLFFYYCGNYLTTVFNNPNLKQWIYISPLSAIFIIIFQTYNEWCVRNKYFKNLSLNKVTNSTATTLGKLLLGITNFTLNGLIIGDVFGRFVSASVCIQRILKYNGNVFRKVSIIRIRFLFRKYIEFPKYSLPGQLIDTINSQLPVLLIASYFFSKEVGFYSMAGNLLSIPAGVISNAVMDVFRQRANEEWNKFGNCKMIYLRVVKLMLILILPTTVILMIFFPSLFSFLLGEKWRMAGIYARILMPNIAILFMFQVVSSVFVIANKMKVSFLWQFFSISLTIVSFAIGILIYKKLETTLILYVIARCIANSVRFYLTYLYSIGRT